MGEVVVINHVSLDGVMQAPGHPDEDRRDGFQHGGWAAPRSDEIMAAKVGEWMRGDHVFLFGRRSYEGMLEGWNRLGGPYMDALNTTRKYVASRNPAAQLQWPNSTLLSGDVTTRVAQLKQELASDLVIMGSGELIASLLAVGAVDVVLLMIHPLVLGAGRRLFGDGMHASLELIDSVPTTTGVLLATYRPIAGELEVRDRDEWFHVEDL